MAKGSPLTDGCEPRRKASGARGPASPAPLTPARTELSDHLDAMDSNLDSLQSMLTSHGFSVDTSALLDVSAAPRPAPPRPQSQPDWLPPPAALQPLDDRAGSEPARPRQQPGQRAYSGVGCGREGMSGNPHCAFPAPADPGAPVSPGAPQASGGREQQPGLR